MIRTSRKLVFVVLLFISLVATATPQAVIKSPNDKRQYEAIELANGLQVLLISDPASSKAAAALDVAVGSADDPIEFQGLAHFLEHMLFLGTQKYPVADEYQKFISEHGGSHNAFTAPEHTNYYFDINASFLEGALDRFSQQFTAPLFNAEYVEREVNAVHSEYSSRIKDDGTRLYSALKTLLRDGHPYKKLSVGNLTTLQSDKPKELRNALLAFYREHYATSKMRLVVLGKEPLPVLKRWVSARFSAIPSPAGVSQRPAMPPYFTEGFLPAKIEIQSIMDQRKLMIAFPVPSAFAHHRSQPIGYLSNLLGHEGEGSLLSALKAEQLVDSLAAGEQFDTKQQTMLNLTIGLTEQGLQQQQRILELLFAYIELMKQSGIRKRYFDEQATMLDISFRYMEKSEPIHLVSQLANTMQDYPTHEVLRIAYDLSHYDEALYRSYLEQLRPDNMLLMLFHKNVTGDKTTEWYDTPYTTGPVAPDLVTALKTPRADAALQMPRDNAFIPEDTALITETKLDKPELLLSKPGLAIWYAADASFGTPKADLFVTLRSPTVMQSARTVNEVELMVDLLKESLNEFSYPAYLAGLDFQLYNHMRGVTVKISGFNDKQSLLLQEILLTLRKAQFPEDRFIVAKEQMQRALQNAKELKPFEQALARLQTTLMDPAWTEEERLAALPDIELADVQAFKQAFFKELDVALLATGNLTRASTLNLAALVDSIVLRPAQTTTVEKARVVDLGNVAATDTKHWQLAFDVSHPDTGFIYYLQGDAATHRNRAQFMLLSQYLASDYYATLRTEKQLGYIVFASHYDVLDVPGIGFIVQSPNTASDVLLQHTQEFLQQRLKVLQTLAPDDFARHKAAVISRLQEKDTTLYERSNRYWQEIDRKNVDFDTRERLIEAINGLDRDGFAQFYEQLVSQRGNAILVSTDPAKAQPPAETQALDGDSRSKMARFAN